MLVIASSLKTYPVFVLIALLPWVSMDVFSRMELLQLVCSRFYCRFIIFSPADGNFYQIKNKLGEGAYAEVFHAIMMEDVDEGDDVCLKVSKLPPFTNII